MRKHKDTDYLFLSSYLHAREARAGEAGSETDRAAILRDLEALAPDPKIVDFFRVKYDYHNAKVFLKSIASNTDNSRLYSPMGRLTPEQLMLAYRDGKKDKLPPTFAEAFLQADELLSRTKDPRQSDFLLDRAYVKELKETAAKTRAKLLMDYAALNADALNLRALVRMLKSGVEPEELPKVLTDCGTVSLKALSAVYPDIPSSLALYRSTGLTSLLPEAEKAARGGGFSAFERDCRGLLAGWMDRARLTPFGEDVLIRYLYRLEAKDA